MSSPTPSSPGQHSRGAAMKQVPAKLGKKIKRIFHHVTSPKHKSVNVVAVTTFTTTASILPSTPPIDILHDDHADTLVSYPKIRYRKSKETGFSRRSSSRGTLVSSDPSSQSSITSAAASTMSEEPYRNPTEEASAVGAPQDSEVDSPSHSDDSPRSNSQPGSLGSQTPEPMLASPPPAVYLEPEVPDPFLIDDEEDSDEDAAPLSAGNASASQQTISPTEMSLAIPLSPSVSQPSPHSVSPLSINLNKDVPPPPSDSEPDDDEAPDLYLPGLIIPTMFLPIPNTDPLTTLLTKYIYPPEKRPVRDVTGDWQRSDFHTLVMSNSWRALARMARDRIVTADPEDLTLILGLWYLRLASLARLRLFNQTSAECTNLFMVLNAIEPPEARAWVFDRILPFELEVMQARIKYWSGDHMGHLDALNLLLKKCKTNARLAKSDHTTVAMWRERGARICLIIASQLVEMKDYVAATTLLEPLCDQGEHVSTSAIRSSIARIYLQSGNIRMASKHIAAVAQDPEADEATKDMNSALLSSAEGDWTQASEILQKVLERDAENFVAVNNLSVALLSQGKLKEASGIDVLETAFKTSPSSVVVAEPFLFNLSTLYELRSATAAENKRNLLIEVAKWSGDGLKTTCLKMPSN